VPESGQAGGWRGVLRSMLAPDQQTDVSLGSSATINAQFWLGQFPLRPTAGWVVVAALLSTGANFAAGGSFLRDLALLVLLVDPLWGSVWRLAAGRGEQLPLHDRVLQGRFWLPYMQPDSPADRLLGNDMATALPLVYRVALPTALLAFAIAFVLGPSAVLLTLLVAVVSALGWISRHTFGRMPALLHSAVTVALPWWLVLSQWQLAPGAEEWNASAALAAIWFVHNWGEGRGLRHGRDWVAVGLLAIADLSLVALLITVRAPLWLGILCLLWLPTWLFVYWRRPWQPLNFWWLATLLMSGLALGQSF
jgi:hypothetical protein